MRLDPERLWYSKHPLSLALLPLSYLFCAIAWLRRRLFAWGWKSSYRAPVPVIIVGNISVGGTGKTPFVIWLAQTLREQGYRPGIISRGYGGQAESWPQPVTADSDPRLVGDEPVLIAQHSGCPMQVGPKRQASIERLLAEHDCDLIISDDGLQHYALQRDIEIVLVDGARGFGNQRCLPAGPLREPVRRLREVDFVVSKNDPQAEIAMRFPLTDLCAVNNPQQRLALSELHGQRVHALAGVGNPESFFQILRAQGLEVIPHRFADHHAYQASDILFADDLPVLMTEKDAIKCRAFAQARHWFLPIQAQLPEGFKDALLARLRQRQTL